MARCEYYQDEKNQLDALLELLQGNMMLWKLMNQSFCMDKKQWEVLRGIITGIEVRENEELLNETYRYGSMLNGKDLLGRQIFLSLLRVLEEKDLQRTIRK
ncbi:MAG: hypothetical protein ACI4AD_11135 [Roseburia sp.]